MQYRNRIDHKPFLTYDGCKLNFHFLIICIFIVLSTINSLRLLRRRTILGVRRLFTALINDITAHAHTAFPVWFQTNIFATLYVFSSSQNHNFWLSWCDWLWSLNRVNIEAESFFLTHVVSPIGAPDKEFKPNENKMKYFLFICLWWPNRSVKVRIPVITKSVRE